MKSIFFVIIFTILLISMLGSAFNVQPVKAEPRTWTVDDDGPADFSKIQRAIDAASSGDTIYVHNGIYYEHLHIFTPLEIIGEDKSSTIIDGSGLLTIIEILVGNVVLSGFTVRNGGHEGYYLCDSGIDIGKLREFCNVSNNIVTNAFCGIKSWLGSNNIIGGNAISDVEVGVSFLGPIYNNTFVGNSISDTIDGFELWSYSYNNTLAGNTITNTTRWGIFFDKYAYYNTVVSNVISDGELGIFFSSEDPFPAYYNTVSRNYVFNCSNGIYFNSAYYNTVGGNTLVNNTDYGIHFQVGGSSNAVIGNTVVGSGNAIRLDYADKNVVTQNIVCNNTFAIFVGYESSDNIVSGNNASDSIIGILVLDNSNNNTILNNVVTRNYYGIALLSSDNNRVYHNNFIENAQQVLISESFGTAWDDGYPSGGNFWSDYGGVDSDGDGIGDLPHVIDYDNQDRYPLVNPCRSDVAVVEIVPSRSWVYQGHSVNANVTVLNEGSHAENVTVTLYYNITANKVIGTQTIDLLPGENRTISFVWNTAGVEYGCNYTITAVAEIVFDNDLTDNTLADGRIKVRILGDVNDDDTVDGSDVIIAARAFGGYLGHLRWDPMADVNEDNVIDGSDLVLIARNFGRTYQ